MFRSGRNLSCGNKSHVADTRLQGYPGTNGKNRNHASVKGEEIFANREKTVDKERKNGYNKRAAWETSGIMQVSPSGMAAASQAVPGEFDSRHLLQKSTNFARGLSILSIYANYLYHAKKMAVVY